MKSAMTLLLGAVAIPMASAMINLRFTPVELYRHAERIAVGMLQVDPTDGTWRVADWKAIKGDAPSGSIWIRLPEPVPDLLQSVAKLLDEQPGRRTEALVVWGDLSDAAGGSATWTGPQPVAVLRIFQQWIALYGESAEAEVLQMRPTDEGLLDPLDLHTVWSGGTDMLIECLHQIARDPRTTVPVVSGTVWASAQIVDELPGPARYLLALRGSSSDPWLLWVGSPDGDRLYRLEQDSWVDVSRRWMTGSRSDLLGVADFERDGEWELVTWTERENRLRVWRPSPEGGWRADAEVELESRVYNLLPVAAVRRVAADVLLGTSDGPMRFGCNPEGGWFLRRLANGGSALRGCGPLSVVDVDEDGLVDIVQPVAGGLALYRGLASGDFADPVRMLVGPWQEVTALRPVDFEASGRFQLLLAGDHGMSLFARKGDAWVDVTSASGEPVYLVRRQVRLAEVPDFNMDGRQDCAFFYGDGLPQLFFNRGFRCFGYAMDAEDSLEELDPDALSALRTGQTAAAFAPFRRNGGIDLMVATGDRRLVWLQQRPIGQRPFLTVFVPPTVPGLVPLAARDGARDLGLRLVRAGSFEWFARVGRGPLDLKWRWPGGFQQERREVLMQPGELWLTEPPR